MAQPVALLAGPEVYYIELDVISGNDLAAKDIGGKSDPFVKITVGGEHRQTKVIKKTLNPEWKEKYMFKFFENPKSIQFVVLDKDMTSNDTIGSAVEYIYPLQFTIDSLQ